MSGAITTAIVGSIAGAVVTSMLAPKQQQQQAPAVITSPQLQAGKLPDQAAVRANATGNVPPGAGGVAGTPSGTLLTGSQGVDSSTVKLGKNVALGS